PHRAPHAQTGLHEGDRQARQGRRGSTEAARGVEGRALALEAELVAACTPLRNSTVTIESLYAEVYANPNDDAPRVVLADALLERNDPRGEFITLQLARGREGEPSARELELLKKYRKQWLGPLATVLSFGKSYSSTAFTRGFVSTADFIFKTEKKL